MPVTRTRPRFGELFLAPSADQMTKHPVTMAIRALRAAKCRLHAAPVHVGAARRHRGLERGARRRRARRDQDADLRGRSQAAALHPHARRPRGLGQEPRARIGTKTVAPCSPEVADRHSGYQVGGTSPFGLKRADADLHGAARLPRCRASTSTAARAGSSSRSIRTKPSASCADARRRRDDLERHDLVGVLLREVGEHVGVDARRHDLERLDEPRPGPIEERVAVGDVDARARRRRAATHVALDRRRARERALEREAARLDDDDVGRERRELRRDRSSARVAPARRTDRARRRRARRARASTCRRSSADRSTRG